MNVSGISPNAISHYAQANNSQALNNSSAASKPREQSAQNPQTDKVTISKEAKDLMSGEANKSTQELIKQWLMG